MHLYGFCLRKVYRSLSGGAPGPQTSITNEGGNKEVSGDLYRVGCQVVIHHTATCQYAQGEWRGKVMGDGRGEIVVSQTMGEKGETKCHSPPQGGFALVHARTHAHFHKVPWECRLSAR